MFPKVPRLSILKNHTCLSNDAISPILPHLIKQKERREFLLRQYNFENGIGLPLYTFADKDYSTHIDSILGLMNTKNQIFYAGEPGFFKLNRETKIVITYSSLLIMNYLKKLENLIKIKDLIIMPKAVEYAILKAYEHSESFDTRLFGTMAINEDGRPVFFKLTEEEKANRLSFWKDITLFIKTVRTIQLDKKLDIEELQIMRELIGDADLECISLAYKQKAILISDDLFVRRATNSFNKNIMSSNIIPILLHTVDDAVELIDCLLLLSNGDYFILYSREVLNSLFDKISQYPPIFSEDTIWGKTQMILRNSLRLPALFKAYIPILLDVYEFLYDSISFKSKNMFMKLIIEEIKHANKTMGLNDIVFINIMKERFGLDIIKYNYFIKMYKPS